MSAPTPRFKSYYLTPQDDGEYVLHADYAALEAHAQTLREALAGVLPYMEQCEAAALVGDEGCHWPVELARAALAATEAKEKQDA